MKHGAFILCTLMLVLGAHALAVVADRVEHRAILITNDYEFTVENGVCSGSGTFADPYIIENWSIDAGYDRYGIRIQGTTRPFVIRNVKVSGASGAAISLNHVENGTLEDCLFRANWIGLSLTYTSLVRISRSHFEINTDGVHFYFSQANQLLDCTFLENDTAIWLDASSENQIMGNLIEDSHMGVYMNLRSAENQVVRNAFVGNLHNAYADQPNVWNDEGAGNYWDGYRAIDANLDGIWDSPYRINVDGDQDFYPLVSHPRVPAAPAPTCEG
ncbi:MAG: NosD domain-containing protein [Candidatus Bipolaricaulota bacterium]